MTDRDQGRHTDKDLRLQKKAGAQESRQGPTLWTPHTDPRAELRVGGTANLIVNGGLVRVELGGGRLSPSIASLGPQGTYTEEALAQMLVTNHANRFEEKLLDEVNEDIVRLVGSGKYDLGVVAGENAIAGDVSETIRSLMAEEDLTILGEEIVRVDHVLAGHAGEEIRELRSHAHAFKQCRTFLDKNHRRVKRVESKSTAQAAVEVRRMKHGAAIASRRAAELNDLDVLAEGIGDNPHNSTRFFLIGRGETEPTGNDTTAIVISANDGPGTLAKFVNIVSDRGINMTKLVSHPSGILGRYYFHVWANGHANDPIMANALEELREAPETVRVRVLGSYKKAELPEGAYDPGTWNGDTHSEKTV